MKDSIKKKEERIEDTLSEAKRPFSHAPFFIQRSLFASSRRPRALTQGFTIIELMVVLSIVLIISSAILFSNSRFNSSILLRGLAYQVGLSLREAQLYGVAVKETAPGTGNFNAAYGVYFGAASIGVQNSTYPLFADLNQNGLYDDGASSVIENFTIRNFFFINNICAVDGSGTMQCGAACPSPLPAGVSACSASAITYLAISFKRPEPDACIMTNTSTRYCDRASAIITVGSQNGSTRSVSVSGSGQISVVGTGN